MSTVMKSYDNGDVKIAGELKELNRGLVLYLDGTYDEENGWFVDKSGHGNHGVPYNGATTGTGVVGDGMNLPNYDSGIQTTTLQFNNVGTICFWFKTTSAGYYFFDCYGGSNNRISMYHSGGRIYIIVNNVAIGSFEYSFDTEYHQIIFEYGANKLYIDGNLENIFSSQLQGTIPDNFYLGVRYSYTSSIQGLLDEIRIYDRALSAEEVSQLYNLGCAKLSTTGDLIVPELVENNCNDVTDGLVLWLDGSQNIDGNFIDRSGNGNDGVPYNGVTSGGGIIGDGISFDGVDDYILTPNLGVADLSGMTITMFIIPQETVLSSNLFVWSGNRAVNIFRTERYFRMYYKNAAGGGDGYFIYDDKYIEWDGTYYVTFTNDGSHAKMYLNGEISTSVDSTNGIYSQDTELYIGSSSGGTANFYKGVIDEIRIYNRALTSDEVATLYKRGMKMKYNKLMVSELSEGESL